MSTRIARSKFTIYTNILALESDDHKNNRWSINVYLQRDSLSEVHNHLFWFTHSKSKFMLLEVCEIITHSKKNCLVLKPTHICIDTYLHCSLSTFQQKSKFMSLEVREIIARSIIFCLVVKPTHICIDTYLHWHIFALFALYIPESGQRWRSDGRGVTGTKYDRGK